MTATAWSQTEWERPKGAEGEQQQQREETSAERASSTWWNFRRWRMTHKIFFFHL